VFKRSSKPCLRVFPFRSEFTIFLALSIFSVIYSVQPNTSLFRYTSFVFEVFLISLIVFYYLDKYPFATLALDALVSSVVVASVFGVLETLMGHSYFATLSLGGKLTKANWYSYGGFSRAGLEGRMQSLFSHPIAFGGFLAMSLPYLYLRLRSVSGALMKAVMSAVMILSLLCILLTLSRSPILSVVVEALLLLVLRPKEGIKMSISVGLVAILVMAAYPPIDRVLGGAVLFWTPTGQMVTLGGSSFLSRINMIENVAYYYMSGHWIAGYGLGSVSDMIRSGYFEVALVGYLENYWLVVLVSSGIMGLIGTVWLFVGILKKLFVLFKKSQMRFRWAVAAISSLFGFLAFATATGDLGLFPYSVLLATIGYRLAMHQGNPRVAVLSSGGMPHP